MRLLRGFGRRVVVRVGRWVWMVVRFVCVIRVPVCARVSRVCPVCVPAPRGDFLPVGGRVLTATAPHTPGGEKT